MSFKTHVDTDGAAIGVIGIVLALIALSGFAYGATQLYAVARVTGIAWHTALSLLALHIGILTARTDAGPITRLVSAGPEGTMLRRQALPMTIVPFLVGYLMLLGITPACSIAACRCR